MKKILSVILTVVLVICIASCGSSSKNSLVGRWEMNSDRSERKISNTWIPSLEFFSDGTYTSNNNDFSGTYTAEGSRLKLPSKRGNDLVYNYTINGDTLILEDDRGLFHIEYDRVK